MRIHDTLQPLARAPRAIKALMDDADAHLGDGAYARVLQVSPARVVKLTSCPASVALLDELHQAQHSHALASALPVVFRRYGAVAEDADGFRFFGYELERLFPAGQLDAMRTARNCHDQAPEQRRDKPPVRYGNQAYWRFERLRRRIARAQARYIRQEQPGWKECLALAGELASERDPFGAEAAFAWLERFIERHQVELDLLMEGNVLLSAWGIPVLADPVSVMAFEPAATEASQVGECAESQAQKHALLVERIESVRGAQAGLRWHTAGRFESTQQAEARARVLQASDARCVRTEVVAWRSESHRRAMHEHAERAVPVWSLSEGARQAVLRDVRVQVRRTDPQLRGARSLPDCGRASGQKPRPGVVT